MLGLNRTYVVRMQRNEYCSILRCDAVCVCIQLRASLRNLSPPSLRRSKTAIRYARLWGISYIHLYGSPSHRKTLEDGSSNSSEMSVTVYQCQQRHIQGYFKLHWLRHSWKALKLQTEGGFETSVIIYKCTRRVFSQNCSCLQHRRENLRYKTK